MVDRLINWGADATDARYQTRDSDPAGGDFVVVNDTTGGGQLLVWDYSAGEWAYGGPVNMGGNDIINAGTVSTAALEADKADTRSGYEDVKSARSVNTVYTNNSGSDLDVSVTLEATADGTEERVNTSIDGAFVNRFRRTIDTNDTFILSVTVQAGSDYKIESFGDQNLTILQWKEQA